LRLQRYYQYFNLATNRSIFCSLFAGFPCIFVACHPACVSGRTRQRSWRMDYRYSLPTGKSV